MRITTRAELAASDIKDSERLPAVLRLVVDCGPNIVAGRVPLSTGSLTEAVLFGRLFHPGSEIDGFRD